MVNLPACRHRAVRSSTATADPRLSTVRDEARHHCSLSIGPGHTVLLCGRRGLPQRHICVADERVMAPSICPSAAGVVQSHTAKCPGMALHKCT